MQRHFRPRNGRDEALHESPARIYVEQATIAPASINFTPSTEETVELRPVIRGSTYPNSAHNLLLYRVAPLVRIIPGTQAQKNTLLMGSMTIKKRLLWAFNR